MRCTAGAGEIANGVKLMGFEGGGSISAKT
jgi:hypothetical protein